MTLAPLPRCRSRRSLRSRPSSASRRWHPLLALALPLVLAAPVAALLRGGAAAVSPPAPPSSAAALGAAAAGAPLRPGDMPWRAAGLTERQAAAHLLARFTFGPRPGDVERVVAMGLERWLETQLAPPSRDPAVERRLVALPSLAMSAEQMAATYPNLGLVTAQARRDGVLPAKLASADAVGVEEPAAAVTGSAAGGKTSLAPRKDPELRVRLLRFADRQGYRPQGELLADLLTQKIVRAVYGEDQLAEVMTDFWFNHFNVSLTNPQARVFVLSYERDAIRPHALGRFHDLVEATAKHPAMLLYLDNARSVAPAGARTTAAMEMEAARGPRGGFGAAGRFGGMGRLGTGRATAIAKPAPAKNRPTGINENYARELLELHTLGVDGGYTQHDVVEVARALTGWTVVPPRALLGDAGAERLRRLDERGARLGFVHEGEFLFRADQHDAGSKTVLGVTIPAGGGIEDGERVLQIVAEHPATARHIATQIAARFVADEPPPALVDRLAATFTRSGGDTREMLRALVRAPEFWAPDARAAKVKSPFELAVSALRALDADVELDGTAALVDWIGRMGQPLYRQQAPTGWPDRATEWVNTGALVARMSFGLQLAGGELPGVHLDLLALDGDREPESPQAALATYAALLLPERDVSGALERLAPLAQRGDLEQRLQAPPAVAASAMPAGMDQRAGAWENPFPDYRRNAIRRPTDTSTLARVVGVLVGSPEFQRR